MAKQLTEDELNLRRRARRRLIGAVALTLAVVVILPMVLDKEPAPTGKDIELRIPSPDKVGALAPAPPVGAATAPKLPSASAVPQTEIPLPAPQAPAPAQPPEEAKPVAPSAGQPAEPKAPQEAGRAGKPATQAPAADKGPAAEGYVAQVGAYSNPASAKQELAQLKKWGFKAYMEKSGDKTRVRVGPYTEREKAEKVGKLLQKHGLHPAILSAK